MKGVEISSSQIMNANAENPAFMLQLAKYSSYPADMQHGFVNQQWAPAGLCQQHHTDEETNFHDPSFLALNFLLFVFQTEYFYTTLIFMHFLS